MRKATKERIVALEALCDYLNKSLEQVTRVLLNAEICQIHTKSLYRQTLYPTINARRLREHISRLEDYLEIEQKFIPGKTIYVKKEETNES